MKTDMDLRAMIIERIGARADAAGRLLDVYNHLVLCGANSDDAMAAISAFVDEIIDRSAERARSGKL